MKAAVIDRYGGNDVVEVRDMPQPRCGAGSVLIKVRAAGVNPVDWKIRSGMLRIFTGSKFPRILGSECSGEVAETGGTLRFKKGDPVIGFPGTRSLGAFAEYVCSPETATFAKPEGLSFEEAACIPIAGLTALQALRDHGRIAPGKNVLVNGASGGVGSFAVQIAKTFGAEVTAVCSAANIELVKSLGADLVIDYGKEDFTKGNSQYDIIFDAVAKRSFGECRKVLAPKGVYVSTLPSFSVVLNQYLTGRLSGRKARAVMVAPTAADMEWMKAHLETGRVKVVIDSVFPLDRSKEALARSEAGRAKGKIVISAV
jgi:NADPH:quinone reductase-like Zn-dependent oxidoreductase